MHPIATLVSPGAAQCVFLPTIADFRFRGSTGNLVLDQSITAFDP
jgi:hypothetical protein